MKVKYCDSFMYMKNIYIPVTRKTGKNEIKLFLSFLTTLQSATESAEA